MEGLAAQKAACTAWLGGLRETERHEVWLDLLYCNQDDLGFVVTAARRLKVRVNGEHKSRSHYTALHTKSALAHQLARADQI